MRKRKHRKMINKGKPKAIDLFCGAGGLTEGLRQAGYAVVGAIEIDPLACKTYRLNHKHVHLWESDIAQISGQAIMKALNLRPGELDLLAACPPCQGFSAMRTKNGNRWNKDYRNELIFDVLRLIRSIKPKSIMLENVPGLSKNSRYSTFRRGLIALGYRVRWDILNTVNYGVPQKRRRLVLLASMVGEPNFAPPVAKIRNVRDYISRLSSPEVSKDPLHNYQVFHSSRVLERIRLIPRNGGSRSALNVSEQLKCHQHFKGFRDVYGRMAWDKPSPTITGGCINPSKGRFLHPSADRAITLREAARLQTFPSRYRFSLDRGRYAVALMIGNALPPEFIRRHAQALMNSVISPESRNSNHPCRNT